MLLDLGTLLTTALWICIAAIPLGVVALAALHAARTPGWVWAFAGRGQVVWIAMLFWGIVVIPIGLTLAIWYWWKICPELRAIESGRFG